MAKVDKERVLALLSEIGNGREVARMLGIHENTVYVIGRKAKGQCVKCTNPVLPGRTMCAPCLDADRQRVMQNRKQRRHDGVCIECGDSRMDGSQFCELHRGAAMARSQRYEAKKKTLPGSPQGGAPNERQKRRTLLARYGKSAVERWDHAGGKCEACGAAHGEVAIHLHHKDENPTNNSFENFACLCFACHRAVHLLLASRDRAGLLVWFQSNYAA